MTPAMNLHGMELGVVFGVQLQYLQYNYTIPSMVMLSVSTSGMITNGINETDGNDETMALMVALLVTLYPYMPGYLPVTVSVLT